MPGLAAVGCGGGKTVPAGRPASARSLSPCPTRTTRAETSSPTTASGPTPTASGSRTTATAARQPDARGHERPLRRRSRSASADAVPTASSTRPRRSGWRSRTSRWPAATAWASPSPRSASTAGTSPRATTARTPPSIWMSRTIGSSSRRSPQVGSTSSSRGSPTRSSPARRTRSCRPSSTASRKDGSNRSEAYSNGGPLYTIKIFNADGGHAITPYAVEDKGDGKFAVLVYDNNYPGITRAVEFDTNANTWSYNAATRPDLPEALYSGDAGHPSTCGSTRRLRARRPRSPSTSRTPRTPAPARPAPPARPRSTTRSRCSATRGTTRTSSFATARAR